MIDPGRAVERELPSPAFEGESRRPAQSYWNESWERLRSNRIGIVCGSLILVLALIAIAAPLFKQFLNHYEPFRLGLGNTFQPPSHLHPLRKQAIWRYSPSR